MNRLLLYSLLLAALSLPYGAAAEIYVYVDQNGVSHYTNAPTDGRYKKARLEAISTPSSTGMSAREAWQRSRRGGVVQSPTAYEHHIRKAALSHEIDPLLLKAIIRNESNFDPFAVSTKGAQGLMQLMPDTARRMRVRNSFDPMQNIYGGARYLRTLLNSYDGNLALSLAAYNAGPGNVVKNGSLPRIPETREYVRRVIQSYRSYQQNAGGTPVSLSTNIKVGKLVTVN